MGGSVEKVDNPGSAVREIALEEPDSEIVAGNADERDVVSLARLRLPL